MSSSEPMACASVATPKRVDQARSCTPRAAAESCTLGAGALPESLLLGPLPFEVVGLAGGASPDGLPGLEPSGFPERSGTVGE